MSHPGVSCDVCHVKPITGPRFKCTVCHDYDMCETCEAKGSHTKNHNLLKIAAVTPDSKEVKPATGKESFDKYKEAVNEWTLKMEEYERAQKHARETPGVVAIQGFPCKPDFARF